MTGLLVMGEVLEVALMKRNLTVFFSSVDPKREMKKIL